MRRLRRRWHIIGSVMKVNKSQAYFWSPSWQAAEHEASEDIAAGRVNIAEDLDDLLAKLDKSRKKNRRSRRSAQETLKTIIGAQPGPGD